MRGNRYRRVMDVLRRRQPDLTVLAESVHKPHNLSAVIRSCDAVGIPVLHANDPTGGVPTYSESSAGANKWVDLVLHDNVIDAMLALRDQGMQILAAHLSDRAVDFREADYTRPTAILLGNEKKGVSEQAAVRADAHVIIPMLGMVESLNVSVAAAVILFEAQRQRRAAGLYDSPRLSEQELNDQAFRWLYPREARLLEEEGLSFPPLEHDGTYRIP